MTPLQEVATAVQGVRNSPNKQSSFHALGDVRAGVVVRGDRGVLLVLLVELVVVVFHLNHALILEHRSLHQGSGLTFGVSGSSGGLAKYGTSLKLICQLVVVVLHLDHPLILEHRPLDFSFVGGFMLRWASIFGMVC